MFSTGQEDYDRLRPLSYPGTNVAVLAFSTTHSSTLENIEAKWWPEIRHHCPTVPIILLSLKADLKGQEDRQEPFQYFRYFFQFTFSSVSGFKGITKVRLVQRATLLKLNI
jgi:small GTP-binding protein